MLYVASPSTDPYFNLAMEQYLFDTIGQQEDIFFLWQNDNAIIIGCNQNAAAEINAKEVAKIGARLVRRLSGGGAVYHDLGNLNFTFITSAGAGGLDMHRFCTPVVELLRSLLKEGSVPEISGRNDILINGKKVSGNAQYAKNGRCMHHGSILFSSDLEIIPVLLTPSAVKMQSKGVASIRSRVTTVAEHLAEHSTLEEFWEKLKTAVLGETFVEYSLTDADTNAINSLADAVYRTWDWNYGASPRFNMQKDKRVEGCGTITVYLEAAGGRIESVTFYGDYFGNRPTTELAELLKGCRLEEAAVTEALSEVDLSEYFHGMELVDFVGVLCG